MPEDVAPRPADLGHALRELVARRSGAIAIDCRIPASVPAGIAPAVVAAASRICEEALDNALRHARARYIAIELIARDERLLVRILDDGEGIEPEALGGAGLLRMDELARAANGRLDVRSAPRAGTCVSVLFDLAR